MTLADIFRRYDARTTARLQAAQADVARLTAERDALRAEYDAHLASHAVVTEPEPVPVPSPVPTPIPVPAPAPEPVPVPVPEPKPQPAPTHRSLFGYAGAPDSIPGVERQITGTWIDPTTWDNLAKAEWMAYDGHYQDYLRRYPDRAVDVGVPLIPYKKQWDLNALLDEAISGARDETYRSMGASLAKHGCLIVYARLAWEMNLAPDMADRQDRAKFIAAWNRAVPLIRAGFAGAARPGQTLHVVFCPLSDGADYRAFYPSNEHVDVIALDVYASMWRTTTPTETELLADVRRYLDALTVFAREKGKPLAIGEWGNWQRVPASSTAADSRGLGDFPAYIDLMFDWAEANPVLYMCYFNLPHNTGLTVADTPRSLARIVARA